MFISNTSHEENQPVHLALGDKSVPVGVNWARYEGPEVCYYVGGVYEFVLDKAKGGKGQRLQINAQNCMHCKTCDSVWATSVVEVWLASLGKRNAAGSVMVRNAVVPTIFAAAIDEKNPR